MTEQQFDLNLNAEEFTLLVDILFDDDVRQDVMRPDRPYREDRSPRFELAHKALNQWLSKVEPTLPPQVVLYDINDDGVRVLRRA